MPWVTRGLRNGILTSRYPARPDGYGDNWHGSVVVRPSSPRHPGCGDSGKMPDRRHLRKWSGDAGA